jgi:septum formation protein
LSGRSINESSACTHALAPISFLVLAVEIMSLQPEIILASASPRRAELLGEAKMAFRVLASDAREPERKPPGIPTAHWPMCLAHMKAIAVRSQISNLRSQISQIKDETILAADTIVVAGKPPREMILNKAANRAHARRILSLLNHKDHRVITGCCLLRGDKVRLFSATAWCRLAMTSTQLEAYLDSNLWRGKAGAYGIQDPVHDPFVRLLRGDFTTVVGLPVKLVQSELSSFLRDMP